MFPLKFPTPPSDPCNVAEPVCSFEIKKGTKMGSQALPFFFFFGGGDPAFIVV